MARKLKLKSLNDIENEIFILEKCEKELPTGITLAGIYETIAEQIENSISGEQVKTKFLQKWMGKYQLKRILSQGEISLSLKLYQLDIPSEEIDGAKLSLARLKTSLTAFRLHSGPFASHPKYGNLSKEEWASLHSFFAARLFAEVTVIGDERIRQEQIDREERQKRNEAQKTEHRQHGHKNHHHKKQNHKHHYNKHHKHKKHKGN